LDWRANRHDHGKTAIVAVVFPRLSSAFKTITKLSALRGNGRRKAGNGRFVPECLPRHIGFSDWSEIITLEEMAIFTQFGSLRPSSWARDDSTGSSANGEAAPISNAVV